MRLFIFALTMSFTATGAYATTGVESVIYTFNGLQPSPLIQASDGNLYGTVSTGGVFQNGFVFSLTPEGAMNVLYNFTGGADGGKPAASLIEGNNGNLYGTNTVGGSGTIGVLFQLTLNGSLTVLHNFGRLDGINPGTLIQDNAGNLFGAATAGGLYNKGTVYEYRATGAFFVVHTFTGMSGDGASPNTQLLQAGDGLVYGATRSGGAAGFVGSLFRFNPSNMAFATFASFPPTGLGDPYFEPSYGMTEGTDGALYGLTAYGGNGYGVVYKVVLGPTPTLVLPLYSFVSFSDGGLVESGLTLGGDHNFYGTASAYGPGGPPNGTIFQFAPSGTGTIDVLYSFSQPDGDASAAPIQGSDGNFYGPASSQIYKLVLTPPIPPPIRISATPSVITLGQSSELFWHVSNGFSKTAANCYAHGDWTGSKALTTGQYVTPTAAGTYVYALTCGGVESSSATVTVNP